MDPYLERFWDGIQGALIVHAVDGLNAALSADLRATLRHRKFRSVLPYSSFRSDLATHRWMEVVEVSVAEKVITAIEVLSPFNKRPGDGMVQFQQKQEEYRQARVSRIEIDLLREGRRMFEFPQRLLPAEQIKPYYVTVRRASKPLWTELYAIDLREPLPVIEIPLRANDEDVKLDLQPLIEHVYRTGRFPIDYDEPCDPPLEGEDAVWARQWLDSKRAT